MTKWTPSQQKAIELANCNIIVSAGAGSGKTAVLTERVLTKVKNGWNLNQLLILTFTRAAALEMKERIRKNLVKENYQEQVSLLDSCYITTFDSFALSIVKRYHYALNLSSSIDITPNAIIEIKTKELLDDIFQEQYQIKNQKFLDMISVYCLKDDQDLKNEILKINNKTNKLVDKVDYLKHYLERYKENKEIIINEYIKEFEMVIKNKLVGLINLLINLENNCSEQNLLIIKKIEKDLSEAKNIFELKEKLNFEIPRKTKSDSEDYSQIKKDINSEIKKIQTILIYDDSKMMEKEIEKMNDNLFVIIDILLDLEKRIEEYKNKNNLFTFYDIAKKAINVVKDNQSIREELIHEFKEIMIDEYQDTSDIQNEFISLISNNNVYVVGDAKQSIYGFRNANPNIFKEKYDNYQISDDLSKQNDVKGIRIDLLDNFRSRKEVVLTINAMFSKLMNPDLGGINYELEHKMRQGNLNYNILPENISSYPSMYETEVLNYDGVNEEVGSEFSVSEKEAFVIGNDIKNKINNNFMVFDRDINGYRKIKHSDFAILIDRATEFEKYKKIFEFLNIPMQIYQDESLLNGYNLKIIKNVLSFISLLKNDSNNWNEETYSRINYLFTSIARSYLFSYSDDYIFTVITNKTIMETEIYQKALEIAKQLDNCTLEEILVNTINTFSFYENNMLVGNINKLQAEINYLITLANSYNYIKANLEDFVQFLDKVIEDNIDLSYSFSVGEKDSVKLMTVHKSKGLEFPICYCSGLGTRFNESDIKSSFLFDDKIGLMIPYYEFGLKDTFLKSIYEYNYKYDEISEKIRLFYVMLTRAKEKLIFVLSGIKSNSNLEVSLYDELKINSFKKMIELVYDCIPHQEISVNCQDIKITDEYKLIRENNFEQLINTNKVIDVKPLNIQFNWKKTNDNRYSKKTINLDNKEIKEKKKFGTEVHYLLEVIDFRRWLFDDLYKQRFTNYSPIILKHIDNFLHCPLFKEFNKINNIYKEYRFIDESTNQEGVIDLMFEDDSNIYLIDYKLKNINDEAYKKQIKGYKDYIEKISNKKIKTYLYSIISEDLEEII